jgi:hypothetical protein
MQPSNACVPVVLTLLLMLLLLLLGSGLLQHENTFNLVS